MPAPEFGVLIYISNKLRQLRLTRSSSLLTLQERQGQAGAWGPKPQHRSRAPTWGPNSFCPCSALGPRQFLNFRLVVARVCRRGCPRLKALDTLRRSRRGSGRTLSKEASDAEPPRSSTLLLPESGSAHRRAVTEGRLALTRHHRDKRVYYQPDLKRNYETAHLQQRFSQRNILADEPALKYKLH